MSKMNRVLDVMGAAMWVVIGVFILKAYKKDTETQRIAEERRKEYLNEIGHSTGLTTTVSERNGGFTIYVYRTYEDGRPGKWVATGSGGPSDFTDHFRLQPSVYKLGNDGVIRYVSGHSRMIF